MFLPLSPSSSHHPHPVPPTTTPGWQRKSADCQVPFKVTNLNNRWSYSFLVTLQFFLPHNILYQTVFRNQKLLGAENLPELKNLSGAKIPLGPKFLNFMGISILRPFMPHACKANNQECEVIFAVVIIQKVSHLSKYICHFVQSAGKKCAGCYHYHPAHFRVHRAPNLNKYF